MVEKVYRVSLVAACAGAFDPSVAQAKSKAADMIDAILKKGKLSSMKRDPIETRWS